MKKLLTLLTAFFLLSSISFEISAQARIDPSNSKYVGIYDGRPCTLDLTTHKSFGLLGINPKTYKYESYPDGKEIECLGTFEIYFGGWINFNLLAYMDEGGETYYIAANEYVNSPEDLIKIAFNISDEGRTVTVYDLDDDPMFGKIKLKLAK